MKLYIAKGRIYLKTKTPLIFLSTAF